MSTENKNNSSDTFHGRLRMIFNGKVPEWAKKLEMSETNIRTNYLKGGSYPGADKLIKLAEHGVSIDWLISGEGAFTNDEKDMLHAFRELDPLDRRGAYLLIMDKFNEALKDKSIKKNERKSEILDDAIRALNRMVGEI